MKCHNERVRPSGGLLSAFFRFAGFQQMPIWPGIDLPKSFLPGSLCGVKRNPFGTRKRADIE